MTATISAVESAQCSHQHTRTGGGIFPFCDVCVTYTGQPISSVDWVAVQRAAHPAWPTPESLSRAERDLAILWGRSVGHTAQEILINIGQGLNERAVIRLWKAYDEVARLQHPEQYPDKEK